VAVGGITLLVIVFGHQLREVPWTSPTMTASYVLSGLLFACELRRLAVARRGGDGERLTVSPTFAIALVMEGPLGLAILAQAAATVMDDIRRRRPPLAVAFDLGQFALTLAAVRLVYVLPQGHDFLCMMFLDHVALWPALAAATTYFVVNTLLVGIATTLNSGRRPWEVLRAEARAQGFNSAILLGLAPITAVVSHRTLVMLPLIVLPLVGVQRNALIAAQRHHESLHDDLTGLPNRTLFRLRAIRALEQAADRGSRVAVVLIDLDHFKEVNDTLGHHVGDGLLSEVARRLTAALPDHTVARLGGDEFAVVVPQAQSTAQVAALVEQAMARLREPLIADGVRIGVQASMGFALFPDHADSIDTLLQRADVALYQAKDTRGSVQAYRPERDTHSVRRLSLHADLHAAASTSEIAMVYQPQVDAITGTLVSVEALMRWYHPVHGAIAPDAFIPLAENSGAIGPLTRRALADSLTMLGRLRPDRDELTVAVNLSPRLLSDLEVPNWIAAQLDRAAIPATRLTVEVTENSIAADPQRAMRNLARLRDLGVRIAIDDFGTGYSSLSYLAKLQPDDLKIDKSFVMRMRVDDTSAVIIRSTIDLAHGLGLQVIAEGVEDQSTYDALTALGCDRMQGYHVSRPLTGTDLAIWADRATLHPSWLGPRQPDDGEVLPFRRLSRSASA
jgi:diguanylate cyclase (GGDEF)-like protein